MPDVIAARRAELLADADLRGVEWCSAWTAVVDRWLADAFAQAFGEDAEGLCLLAAGGYGRRLLAPHSDLDVVLVHGKRKLDDAQLRKLWYPVWDSGLRLGHAVRSVKWRASASDEELDSVTALLTSRPIAGDPAVGDSLLASVRAAWRSDRRKWMPVLHARCDARHHTTGEVAFMLEPDLKQGRGGLRDVSTVGWMRAAAVDVPDADVLAIDAAERTLVDARVGLHRVVERATDVVLLDDQDAVAEKAGFSDATQMMTLLASAARDVAWVLDAAWGADERWRVRSWPAPRRLAPGVVLDAGEVHLQPSVSVESDPTLALRVAVASARCEEPIARATLDRLTNEMRDWPDPWPPGAVDELVSLLLEGERAIPAWEALDHAGLLVRMLPEWEPLRARPQRNAYHRFTVDRHSWEAAAEAARLVERVRRADLLLLGALFHDIGKGYPGDHTEAGMEVIGTLAPRLGLSSEDGAVLRRLVELHLLLPDVATRRDLADPATLESVAGAVRDGGLLDLLAALTEADSLATGPTAWSAWKAELIHELVERVHHVLGGGAVEEVTWRLFPTGDVLARMGEGELWVGYDGDTLISVSPDRPGTLSRVAGALALHDLDVVAAGAHSDEQGMAASWFRFVAPDRGVDREAVLSDVRRALDAELALSARLAERARTYRRQRRRTSAARPVTSVTFDQNASHNSTVIEVRAPDTLGLLHRLAAAFAELGLDVRHATVQTLGAQAIDTFYVRRGGGKLVDEAYLAEVERATLHAVGSPA